VAEYRAAIRGIRFQRKDDSMRALLTTFAALALAAPLSGQTGVEVTVKGGLSFGDVSNKGLLPGSLKTRTGFAAGAALASRGVVGLAVEGLFAQRGVESANPVEERKLDYVDVPVFLRVMLPSPAVRPFAYVGPQASFELRCRAGPVDCDDASRKKTTYAGVIGGGVRFGAVGGFQVEARYIYGLDDLKLGTVTSGDSYKTRSFMLLAGISF
jgi:hypothetical protein